MSAVYRIIPVRFVDRIPIRMPDKASKDVLRNLLGVTEDEIQEIEQKIKSDIMIEEKDPYRNGILKNEVKKAVVKIILYECQRANKRMCVVFSAKECVFCEPDGSTTASKGPPSGGLTI
jgi:hypothetical protein